jgi:hypothetical protein
VEVKGIAVRSTPLFIRQRFSTDYDAWMASLPEGPRAILQSKVSTDAWYPLKDAFVVPTQKVCDLFFQGRKDGALEIGRFSADYALWGLLRLFVRIGSPHFIIKRASKVFTTYYRPTEMVVAHETPNSTTVLITRFPQPNELVELRIAGWMERALHITGCQGLQIHITRSLARGDPATEFNAQWR